MRIGVTVFAQPIAQAEPLHRFTIAQRLGAMAFITGRFCVIAGQREVRNADVVKDFWVNFELGRGVAIRALFHWRVRGELTSVFVFMAAFTLAWHTTEGCVVAGFGGIAVAACAGRGAVGTSERPR